MSDYRIPHRKLTYEEHGHTLVHPIEAIVGYRIREQSNKKAHKKGQQMHRQNFCHLHIAWSGGLDERGRWLFSVDGHG